MGDDSELLETLMHPTVAGWQTSTPSYDDAVTVVAPSATRVSGEGAAVTAGERDGEDELEISVNMTLGQTVQATRNTVLPRQQSVSGTEEEDLPRYERQGVLGRGAMGEVTLAKDHDIEREVAVKRLRPELSDPGALSRFAEEVRTIGRLEHPGIVPVHDVGIDEAGQHYVVMKYVRGETLQQVIRALKAKSPEHVARYTLEHRARICAGIMDAVGYAHARGIIHRDLKPANIMIGPEGEVTVMDWGLAKDIGTSDPSENDVLLGTPVYMSPEQAARKNGELDARSDVYSLALVFVELMSLAHPWVHKRGQGMDVLVHAIANDDLNYMTLQQDSVFTHGMPCEYFYWLEAALRRDPDKREYADAAAMSTRLKLITDGKIPIRCHFTLTQRALDETGHWVGRHPYVFTALFWSTMLAAVAGSIGAAWMAMS